MRASDVTDSNATFMKIVLTLKSYYRGKTRRLTFCFPKSVLLFVE